MFKPVDGNVNFPEQELAVGRFWKERDIYRKSLEARAGAPPFVFYEGPPTANGMPHPGHCLTRAIKDLFPRYHTMRGRFCERKAGWDTHGLPVEVEVCKELGIHSKEEIEAYGIEPFIQKCQQSVWRYMQEWERLTERIGFWVDLDAAYVTYHQSYVESVWWSLKNLFDRGLLYQGHKIVWWWAQGGTALSAGEVGQGYRQVADPSVYGTFPIVVDEKAKQLGLDENTSLLVWTTTPWTLPSNQFVAVNPRIEYWLTKDPSDSTKTLIVANERKDEIVAKRIRGEFGKASGMQELIHRAYGPAIDAILAGKNASLKSLEIRKYHGEELVGLRYVPPFDWYSKVLSDVTGTLKGSSDELFDPEDVDETQHLYWRIVAADFVTTDSGTGLVHLAPAFGEDDFNVLLKERDRFNDIALRNTTPRGTQLAALDRPELQCPVDPDGKFNEKVPDPYRGRWVKDCNRDIIRDLKQRGLLFHQEQYVHDYPFCWRAEEDPLIQYPRKSWFIKTSEFKDQMLANNAEINWLPEHIKDGRFGNFLASNVDWALSRERYWGTPLPIWKCDKSGQMEAIASYDELLAKPGLVGQHVWHDAKQKNPNLADDLQVHKPYIDAITYDSPFAAGARMHRVPEVIDCWYDSGAMPFAQWGFPNTPGSELRFDAQFPADFISEALDQTRGWFYSQLAISTLLFGPGTSPSPTDTIFPGTSQISRLPAPSPQSPTPFPHPYKNCIVLGLMLGEDGQKMSKSKRNYLAPDEIFDRYGADALRWYFFANQPPWTSIRYSEQAIKDSIPEFLLRLWNCYSFFVIYANIDSFDPGVDLGSFSPPRRGEGLGEGCFHLDAHTLATSPTYRPIAARSELDRWILSELNRTGAAVCERMDAYDNFAACAHITEFIDALSNWYVRRSRDRFWAADKKAVEKLDAYWTLYECLVTTAKLIAPFVPFLAETLWQNLAGVFNQNSPPLRGGARGGFGESVAESVHLTDYPTGDAAHIDESLSARMNLVREISSLGRNARSAASLKVRQPLAKVEVVLADTTHQKWLEEHAELIAEELNVKQVAFTTRGEDYITYSVVPNFKRLGPRLGKNMPAAKKLLADIDAGKLLAELKSTGKAPLKFPDGTAIDLDNEDIEVRLQAKPGWAAAQGKGSVVVLSTELTPDLIAEGTARDIVRLIQDRRKDLGLNFTDRIYVGVKSNSASTRNAVKSWIDYIKAEVLSIQLGCESHDVPIALKELVDTEPIEAKLGDETVAIYVKVAN